VAVAEALCAAYINGAIAGGQFLGKLSIIHRPLKLRCVRKLGDVMEKINPNKWPILIIGYTIVVAIAVCVLFALRDHLLLNGDDYGDLVKIENRGTKPIFKVTLGFSGGECKLDLLPQNSWRNLIVNVRGESALSLSFVDGSGAEHKKDIDVYLEPGHGGSVNIFVDSANNVTYQNPVSP
jgi:hypothetical protein